MAYNSAQFARKLNAFAKLATDRWELLFRRVHAHVRRSILYGSDITGAPGQPKLSGDLIKSWEDTGSDASYQIAFISRLVYAKIIEDNFRGATLRSKQGGFHSVKMTRSAFHLIVKYELDIVKRAIPDGRGVGSTWRDSLTGRFV